MKAHWYKVPRKRSSRLQNETDNQAESTGEEPKPLVKIDGKDKRTGFEKVKVK